MNRVWILRQETTVKSIASSLALIVCTICSSRGVAAPAQVAGPVRPIIVFVMTDDQAPWALGVSGHPHARTPNMDRLAHSGAYLINAFSVTPVCSPSRASILASRYGSEVGITDYINPTEPEIGLDPSIVTWPKLLHKAGYATGLVGKWHLGTDPRFHPKRNGFDEFMGFVGGGTTPKDPQLEFQGATRKFSGFTYDILTDEAMAFVRRHREQPFLLMLCYRAPHAPYMPQPESDSRPFQNLDPQIPNPDYPLLDVKRVKTMTREYLGSVAGVDRNLGRLLGLLDELRLTHNTLVIFTSDHGYNIGHNGIWHKGNGRWILTVLPPGTPNIARGDRPNMYDNSLRVPAIVRWPAAIKPGTVVRPTVTHLDWYPTILAAAGVPLDPAVTIRGRDMLGVLRGEKVERDDQLYAEYSLHHQSRTHMRAWRTDRWKLVRDFLNPERDELYDLQRDPAEAQNLIHDPRSEVVQAIADLHTKIVKRMRELHDPALELVRPASVKPPG